MVAFAPAESIEIKNRRPSNVLAFLDPSAEKSLHSRVARLDSEHCTLLPKGMVLTAHDEKSEIEVTGPAEGFAEVQKIVAEFDVKPAQVTITARVWSKLDKYEATTTSHIDSGSKWSFKDGTLDITVTISPRVIGDGTVMGNVRIGDGNNSIEAIGRKRMLFQKLPDGSIRVGYAEDDSLADAIYVDVKFEISK